MNGWWCKRKDVVLQMSVSSCYKLIGDAQSPAKNNYYSPGMLKQLDLAMHQSQLLLELYHHQQPQLKRMAKSGGEGRVIHKKSISVAKEIGESMENEELFSNHLPLNNTFSYI